MNRLRKTAALLLLVGIPAAAAPYLVASPDLCFTAGSVTYRLSSTARSSDYRVAIDNRATNPDVRIRLVDRVEAADFALSDDAGTITGNACQVAGTIRTARIVAAGAPSDIIVAVSPHLTDPDLVLYVHSARVTHFDAAALLALVRSTHRSGEVDHELDGGPDHVAAVR
jgi:hypothetical protein